MPYNANIPQPNDLISQSQQDILNNFQALQTLIDVNHVDFASGDQGKHKWVSFPQQVAPPVTAANEVALFSQLSTLSGSTELVFRNDANGTAYEFTSFVGNTDGWARLPSGILFKWGNSTANGLTAITFPVNANTPAFTNIFQILVTTAYNAGGADGNGFVRLNNFIAPYTQFNVYASQRTTTTTAAVAFNYLAIGI